MDFPSSLRPSLFMAGPLGMTDGPDLSFMCSWRDRLTLPQNCKDETLSLTKDLLWEPTTPGPLPLLPPSPDPWDPGVTARDLLFRGGYHYRRHPQVVLDETEQLSRFLWDHGDIAFAPLGKLMLENFRLEGNRNYSKKMTVVSAKKLLQDLGGHQPWGQVASEKANTGSWHTVQVSIVPLGFPQPPAAALFHPREPCPEQVSVTAPGQAAA
uniref:Uncharacterized protein n=1 Tax=Nannospalax galili TaxID=1026970 RepID=A0A8C6W527_NANGA